MALSKKEQSSSLHIQTQCSQTTKQDRGQVYANSGRVMGLMNPEKTKSVYCVFSFLSGQGAIIVNKSDLE